MHRSIPPALASPSNQSVRESVSIEFTLDNGGAVDGAAGTTVIPEAPDDVAEGTTVTPDDSTVTLEVATDAGGPVDDDILPFDFLTTKKLRNTNRRL